MSGGSRLLATLACQDQDAADSEERERSRYQAADFGTRHREIGFLGLRAVLVGRERHHDLTIVTDRVRVALSELDPGLRVDRDVLLVHLVERGRVLVDVLGAVDLGESIRQIQPNRAVLERRQNRRHDLDLGLAPGVVDGQAGLRHTLTVREGVLRRSGRTHVDVVPGRSRERAVVRQPRAVVDPVLRGDPRGSGDGDRDLARRTLDTDRVGTRDHGGHDLALGFQDRDDRGCLRGVVRVDRPAVGGRRGEAVIEDDLDRVLTGGQVGRVRLLDHVLVENGAGLDSLAAVERDRTADHSTRLVVTVLGDDGDRRVNPFGDLLLVIERVCGAADRDRMQHARCRSARAVGKGEVRREGRVRIEREPLVDRAVSVGTEPTTGLGTDDGGVGAVRQPPVLTVHVRLTHERSGQTGLEGDEHVEARPRAQNSRAVGVVNRDLPQKGK